MKPIQTAVIFIVFALLQSGFFWDVPQDNKKAPAGAKPKAGAPAQAAAPGANIPFPQMMGMLSQNMTIWNLLPPDSKKRAVEASILVYRNRDNAAILNPAEGYVTRIDDSIKNNPQLQGLDLMQLLKILAVMEYDFYNGQNKDALAKEILGEKMYQSIKMRRQVAGA